MTEKNLQIPARRIPLMETASIPNSSVVEQMKDREYRLQILKQMLEQRFLTNHIDVSDLRALAVLDAKIINLIQESFGNEVIGNKKAHALYIDLCFNQNLLSKALEALKNTSTKLQ